MIIRKIKFADFIRTICNAVAGADAPVIRCFVYSSDYCNADTGQTFSQVPARNLTKASQKTKFVYFSDSNRLIFSQFIERPFSTSSSPTQGTLFSIWQAITQAPQPLHFDKSTTIPQ